MFLYGLLSVLYRNYLTAEQRKTFEMICTEFREHTDLKAVAFVLGKLVDFKQSTNHRGLRY